MDQQPVELPNNSVSSGFEFIEKQYVQLGNAESYSADGMTVQQTLRTKYLKMLFTMTPSANQAITKIENCILSDGWAIRPKDRYGSHDEKARVELQEELEEMGMTDVLKYMIWSYHGFGDSFIYTPFGSGKYKNRAAGLEVLSNEGIAMDMNRNLYEKSGIVKVDKYRYEIQPIMGSMGGYKRKVVVYDPKEVIRWKRKTPYSLLFGTAPLEEDQATLMLGLKVLNHNLKFFSNSAKPPLIVKLGPGTDMAKAMEYKRVLDSRYKGSQNTWETMVTWGGTEVEELTLPDTTSFMDFLTYVRIQVCGLYDVPPQEIGVIDKSGLNNAETSHKDFIKTNVNTKKLELGQLLTRELLKKRMGVTDFEVYLPPMDAITEKQRAETNATLLQSGQMTFNEARESLGKDIKNEDWAKALVYGNFKGVKGVFEVSDFKKDGKTFNQGAGNGKDGASSGAGGKKDGGRPDLAGRTREPHDSINSDSSK